MTMFNKLMLSISALIVSIWNISSVHAMQSNEENRRQSMIQECRKSLIRKFKNNIAKYYNGAVENVVKSRYSQNLANRLLTTENPDVETILSDFQEGIDYPYSLELTREISPRDVVMLDNGLVVDMRNRRVISLHDALLELMMRMDMLQ